MGICYTRSGSVGTIFSLFFTLVGSLASVIGRAALRLQLRYLDEEP